MLTVMIENMQCAGCAAGVKKAVNGVDTNAAITIDLATKRVDIASLTDNHKIIDAIKSAGYAAVVV